MSNEEFEMKMEFIVNQQAQFTVDIQQLRESQAQTELLVNRLAAATLEGFKDVNAKIDALVDSQMRTEESLRTLSRDVNAKIDALVDSHMRLSESQAHTDETLKNLMAGVDRYFRERNGRSEG
ncbi:MAG: hypothetical protein M3416_18920 [Acidobacteriota bacterium]|nr:hypothetical protein [Acidobacteriota bacterium]